MGNDHIEALNWIAERAERGRADAIDPASTNALEVAAFDLAAIAVRARAALNTPDAITVGGVAMSDHDARRVLAQLHAGAPAGPTGA